MSEEIVRRLRNRSKKDLLFLKESMPVNGITEAEEEDEEEEDEENIEKESDKEVDITDIEDEDLDTTSSEEEETPEEKSVSKAAPTNREQHVNPLDNAYAVRYTLGDEVVLSYSDGNNTEMRGIIDGYDKEGFYRIKWSSGLTTNGITDIALSDLIATTSISESRCLCGCNKFVKEGKSVVCDSCGRRIRESAPDTIPAYTVFYDYDGDTISDYQSKLLVLASSPEEAIRKAKKYKPEGRFFTIEKRYDSIEEYQRKFPRSNLSIVESSDPLMLVDKSRPKGKKMIRSEAHPISTAIKPSIAEAIKSAFRAAPINESDEEDEDSDTILLKLSFLRGEFWSRASEMKDDIRELGFEIEDSNDEYILISFTDDEGEDKEIQIPIIGTSNTIALDIGKAIVL